MHNRFAGRNEPIREPHLPILDAHHHLFDRPTGRYLFADYLDDVNAGHNVVASIYVETQAMARSSGPDARKPLDEIEFANGAGAMGASGVYGRCRIACGIIGFADLTLGDAVGDLLDLYSSVAPDRLRGIRQPTLDHPSPTPWKFVGIKPPSGLLEHPSFSRGFRHLATRGLTFDAAVFSHQLADIARLADEFPDTTIVLDHMGHIMALDASPDGRTELFRLWRADLKSLAERHNVVCKVGGLGLPFWGLGFESRTDAPGYRELAESWAPYAETAIELFGARRAMMESNYPVDGRSCGFVPLWNALKFITRGASDDERTDLFHDTAARVYRIDTPLIGLESS